MPLANMTVHRHTQRHKQCTYTHSTEAHFYNDCCREKAVSI